MPTLNKTFQAPGGIGRTCRGQDDGGQPRPILQVAFVESPCRTAVTDNDLDRRGIGNALDMCRHNVADARVARALNVAALNCIPQGHAAVQQHGPLGGHGGIERRGLTACQRIALVGRHRHTEAHGHHKPKAILRVAVIKGIGARKHRGKRPEHQNARTLVKHGLKPMLNMLIALVRRAMA